MKRVDERLVNLKKFVFWWNTEFPIDRWWREKHEVAFNSDLHRNFSFIDELFEFQEDMIFKELRERRKEAGKEEKYIPGRGNWLGTRELSQKEIDDIYDNIDLSKYDTLNARSEEKNNI